MQAFLIISFFATISGVYSQNDNCLQCICGMESGIETFPGCGDIEESCDGIAGCRDVGGLCYCGPYQIRHEYYMDCATELGWETDEEHFYNCTTREECSEECIRGYMRKYGFGCTLLPYERIDCQYFGGMHKGGGPLGCYDTSTFKYREKIVECCARTGMQCEYNP